MTALSVVIPTRDRAAVLMATLDALGVESAALATAGQTVEVIVIDDGSGDDTPEKLTARAANEPGLIYERQMGRGPAAARNRGVALAGGERVLFLGDDTRPAPGTLAAHLEAAAGREIGVQGMIEWDPEAEITEVMRFLAPAGPQFYFAGLEDGREVPYSAVLGSNYSAPRRFLELEPFDEGFPHAAFEDTELAWRFARRGWRSYFCRRALCWHHHHYATLEPFLARQRRAGRAARHAVSRHPRMAGKVILEPLLFGLVVLARHGWRSLIGRGRHHDRMDIATRRAFVHGLLSAGTAGDGSETG